MFLLANIEMFNWTIHSLRKQVTAEVRRQRMTNPTLLAARHTLVFRIIQGALATEEFWCWIAAYIGLVIVAALVDGGAARLCLSLPCPTAAPALLITDSHTHLFFEIGGYLIGAQVGALAALSIAVSLVTLIGQNGNADADVQVYYYESLTLPLVASSVALLAVLCVQLVWPVEIVARSLGFATASLTIPAVLTTVHMLWLFLNLAAFAHFAIASLSFGQPESRAASRRRYTAACVIPEQLRDQLSQAYYFNLPQSLSLDTQTDAPSVWFRSWSFQMPTVEIASNFRRKHQLVDIWQIPLGWALRNWIRRVKAAKLPDAKHILLCFTIGFGQELEGSTVWCRRRGGLPFNRCERFLIRLSFRFGRIR